MKPSAVLIVTILLMTKLDQCKSKVKTDEEDPLDVHNIGYIDSNPINELEMAKGKRDNKIMPRILKGDQVKEGKFKWVVALIYQKRFFCGGTVINDDTILTAAHCFPKKRRDDVKSITVLIGVVDVVYSTTNDMFKGKQVFVHPKYKTNPAIYDFALLKLDRVIDFDDKNSRADSSCLPLNDDASALDVNKCLVVGWGSDKYNVMRTTMMTSEIRLLNFYSCITDLTEKMGIDMNGTQGRVTPEVVVCGEGNQGVRCYGDSGSPLVCPYKNKAGYNLIGVVSFSRAYCMGNNVYFSRIKTVTKWIKSKAEAH